MAPIAARDTKESALVIDGILNFPMAAATTIYGGDVVCTDASGNAVPLSATTAIKAWGRAERTVINTAAAGFGTAGDLRIDSKRGVFALANGSGADAITAAHVGRVAYGSTDATANLTDDAGLRPALGKIYGLLGSQVLVGIGEPSLYDLADDIAPVAGARVLAARNVITAAITLTAYTVAANQGVNDDILNVAGDVVAVLAQTSAAANGLYVCGTVDTGTCPLTRISALPTGYVFDENAARVYVAEGRAFGGSTLANTAAGTIGTNDPVFRVRAAPAVGIQAFRARNVVNSNVADLSAYTVASNAANNDATLGVENDIVLLVAQTTATQNGLYVIGTVGAGVAPLTRLAAMPSGYVFGSNEYEISVTSGTLFGNTKWFNSLAGTIGTDASGFVPESVTISQALVAGTMTLISVPILSATKSAISAYRKTANTSTLTVGGYVTNGTATAGALGTASVEVMAAVGAGTINDADISTLHVTIRNR